MPKNVWEIEIGTRFVVTEPLSRTLREPSAERSLTHILDEDQPFEYEAHRNVIIPAGVTVEFAGNTYSDRMEVVGVFRIMAEGLGESVQAFRQQYGNWLFIASERTIEKFLK